VAFVKGDPVEAAKGLRDFGRAHPALVVKGGVLDGKPLTADEVRKLAELESREVLLAKLAGAMLASLQQAVSLFAAPLSQAARVLGALEEQRRSEAPAAEEPEAPAAEPEAPAAEAEGPAAEPEAPAAEPEAPAAEPEAPAAEAEIAETPETTDTTESTETTETDVAGDATSTSE
jgi:large subunit ribosomal protein L10